MHLVAFDAVALFVNEALYLSLAFIGVACAVRPSQSSQLLTRR